MMPITPAVKHLLLINILMFFGTSLLMQSDRYLLALFYPQSMYFESWQPVTHMFMHVNFSHLLFNMLTLFFIGPMMERTLGTYRFVNYFLICGFGGAILHVVFQWVMVHFMGQNYELFPPVMGASGAINGLFIGLAYLFPNLEMYLMFIPVPVKAKYLAIFTIAADMFFGLSGGTGIAHWGHLGGALFGFLFLYRWLKR